MNNFEVARLFFEIADILELQGVKWKPIAYRNAARNINSMQADINELHSKGELEKIPGIGEHLAKKIRELLETGKMHYYDELKKEFPFDIEKISSIPGIGPKKAFTLYKKLDIATIDDLKKAALAGKIKGLGGFGEKSEENILKGIALLEKSKGRIPLPPEGRH